MVEELPKKETEKRGIINRLVRFKKEAAVALAPFLFLGLAREPAEAQNFYQEVIKALKPSSQIEMIASTEYVRKNQEVFQSRVNSRELTEQMNDIEMIRKFLAPEMPIGTSWFYSLGIDAPSKFNFGPIVQAKIRDVFTKAARMNWVNNIEVLRELPEKAKYEISRIYVRVGTEEQRNVIIEIIRDLSQDVIARELEKRGVRKSTVYEMLDRLSVRFNAMAIVEIEVRNLNTNEYLTLRAFGVPRKVGPIMIPLDRDLAVEEAIDNAFDNLYYLLKKARKERIYQSEVIIVAPPD